MGRPPKLKVIRRLVDEASDDEDIEEAEMFGEKLIDDDLIEEQHKGDQVQNDQIEGDGSRSEVEKDGDKSGTETEEESSDDEEDSSDDEEESSEEDSESENSSSDSEYVSEEDSSSEDDCDDDILVDDMTCEEEMAEEWRAGFAASLGREPRMWHKKSHLGKIDLALGDRFESASWFRIVLRLYSAQKGFCFRYTRNQKNDGIGAACKENGCPFYIWCGLQKGDGCYAITNLRTMHRCTSKELGKSCTSTAIAWRLRKYLEKPKKRTVGKVCKRVLNELAINISVAKAYRIIKKGEEFVHQELGEQYGMLRKYGDMVMKSNPDSRFVLIEDDSEPPRFKRVYIRYGAQKSGFVKGCRPFIGLDGCHLKAYHGGIVLAAVAMDANDGMFPLALAVVEQETKDSWGWFVEELLADLELGEDNCGLVFMSDKQKGLIEVLSEHPEVEHRHCMRHLYENWYKSFKSYELKKLLWKCSRSTSVEMLEEYMEEMKGVNEKAYIWLQERPPEHWCKAYFKTTTKCAAQTNNVCESFNAWIGKGRELPILSFLEFYRKKLMGWFCMKGNMIHESQINICPRIHERFEIIMKEGLRCPVLRSGTTLYEVTEKNDTYQVDIETTKCTCLEWELRGIPCKHGVAAITDARGNPISMVSDYYSVETFKKIYGGQIFPIQGIKKCRKIPHGQQVLLPPVVRRQPGRPRVRRRKGFMERQGLDGGKRKGGKSCEVGSDEVNDEDTSAREKVGTSRKGIKITCSNCGNTGHNKRTCSTKDYGVNLKPKSKSKQSWGVRGDEEILASLLDQKRAASDAKREKDRKRKQLERLRKRQQAAAAANVGNENVAPDVEEDRLDVQEQQDEVNVQQTCPDATTVQKRQKTTNEIEQQDTVGNGSLQEMENIHSQAAPQLTEWLANFKKARVDVAGTCSQPSKPPESSKPPRYGLRRSNRLRSSSSQP